MNNQPQAELEWRDGTIPISRKFDDPYFSLDNGLAETRHVFIEGNDLPQRFGGDFQIGELGFGTGLNFLTVWKVWEEAGSLGTLSFTTFEAFPMAIADMENALTAFPEVAPWAAKMIDGLTKGDTKFGPVTLNIVVGDVRQTLHQSDLMADAWFLDGFSPAKNPEMWGADLMAEVGRHTVQNGTAATYTAAGHVRRALEDAGFVVTRTAGYGRKRHMTRAIKS
ncbi:MAG: tRNA (5-methylaminomethyl-2-thiouridine)(34)-methyltransferase MnmD [Marivivens sp.]|uniref:tRNA (5-methylaminomethyl-2-thiouridine)(34)-methyltransferase MnmD n=1 Tax=Marivivens sp. TaxID=1978374 RepID=UPI00179FF1E7|nr:tRNA (5-methylaminomethyl-2-thiouridine)(34)-methyltransferase MnmD [Marivivens sp.]NVJ94939.1 tRNA (5-methylaminomethyl-2-thiouridine)(34)-methyltransferase MnmD [Marivivens sp.]